MFYTFSHRLSNQLEIYHFLTKYVLSRLLQNYRMRERVKLQVLFSGSMQSGSNNILLRHAATTFLHVAIKLFAFRSSHLVTLIVRATHNETLPPLSPVKLGIINNVSPLPI